MRGLLFGGTLIALFGAGPVATLARGASPEQSVYVPVRSGTERYMRPLRPHDAEVDSATQILLPALDRALGKAGRADLQKDIRLHHVAMDVATLGATPGLSSLTFLLAHHGIVEVDPAVAFVRGGHQDPAALAAAAENNWTTLLHRAPPSGRIGVAFLQKDDLAFAVLIAVSSGVNHAPIVKEQALADAQTLQFTLPVGFAKPQVVVQTPPGRLGQIPTSFDKARRGVSGPLRCIDGAGRYQVEYLATGPDGVTVLANFPVFCGAFAPGRMVVENAAASNIQPVTEKDPEGALIDEINRQRTRVGLAPLVADKRLALLAARHSANMVKHNKAAHVLPGSGDLQSRAKAAGLHLSFMAENVGVQSFAQSGTGASATRRPVARDLMSGFMASPGHRANVLHKDARVVGVAIVAREDKGVGRMWYVTQIFAAF